MAHGGGGRGECPAPYKNRGNCPGGRNVLGNMSEGECPDAVTSLPMLVGCSRDELSEARSEIAQLRSRISTLNVEVADHGRRSSASVAELNAAQQHISFITGQLESSRTLGTDLMAREHSTHTQRHNSTQLHVELS